MSILKTIAITATVALAASPALAWKETQPAMENSGQPLAYHGPNYCPAGFTPVVLMGVVCCGDNAGASYAQMMSHPMPTRKKHHHHTVTHSHVKTHSHTTSHSH